MIWLITLAVILVIFLGPQIWARRVMSRHAGDRPDYPGTGGELARHLLDHTGLQAVTVETTEAGDHYDAQAKAVRLSPANHDGRSLTAVAVAAHEVGHALQDRDGYKPLAARHRLVGLAMVTDRIGSAGLFGLSILGSFAISPRIAMIGIAAVALMGLVRVVAHFVTLPVELDASFNRALPILAEGRYLPTDDLPAARQVLNAAAYTYVAGALMQVLNLFRFIRWLR